MSNKPLSRKAKEIQSRNELIMSEAQILLATKGLQGLTMQAIADRTDYSKGTIYQHFGCKEEILASFVLRDAKRMAFIMDEILSMEDSLRYKLVLLSDCFFVNTRRQPEITGIVAMVKSPDFQSKLGQQYRDEIKEVEQAIMLRVVRIFTSDEGFDVQKAKQAGFGWWAMKWGVQDVLSNGWELASLGFDSPEQSFFDSLHIYLNGFGVSDDPQSHDLASLQSKAKALLESSFEFIKTKRKPS